MAKTAITITVALLLLAALLPLRQELAALSNEPIANCVSAGLGLLIMAVSSFILSRKSKQNRQDLNTGSLSELQSIKSAAPQSGKTKEHKSSNKQSKKICLICNREFPADFQGKCPDDQTELSKISGFMSPGSIFSEYYQIIGPLGEGNLSRVFHARHISSKKDLAIKMLHSHLCQDNLAVQRFQREARALSQLSHPNLISVQDFLVTSDGIPFLIMDYLEGETLQQVMKRERAMNWKEAASIFVQVCKGLSHAHAKGVIHRDLKPSNIMLMLDKDGALNAKVLDFGLAKTSQKDSLGRITATGEIFGSPLYMSPEQCRGEEVDRRSDVYSIGCIIYESLTGTAPFIGKNVTDTLSLHLQATVPAFPPELELPSWLIQITLRCLEKDPGKRFQSIDDLGGSLQDGLRYAGKRS